MSIKPKLSIIISFIILSLSIIQVALIPIVVNSEMEVDYSDVEINDIYDFVSKKVILRKKAIFDILLNSFGIITLRSNNSLSTAK